MLEELVCPVGIAKPQVLAVRVVLLAIEGMVGLEPRVEDKFGL